MASDKYATFVRLDRKVHDKLAIIADREHRSVNSLIGHYIMNLIDEYEKKNGEIKVPDE